MNLKQWKRSLGALYKLRPYQFAGETKYGDAWAKDILIMLGVKGHKLPREAIRPQDIGGAMVYVTAQKLRGLNIRGQRSHRVMVVCPECAEHCSVGRANQHVCKKGA